MSNNIVKIGEITNKVSSLTKFEVTAEYLKKEVKKTKHIKATDLEDKKQLEIVKRARIDLRDTEIDIQKIGKGFRDTFTKLNKDILVKERELLAITNPEVDRLKTIEDEAKQIEIKKERLKILPHRKERLVDFKDIASDEELLDMDDQAFDNYLIEKQEEKLEEERELKRQQDIEDDKKRVAKKAKEEAEEKAKEDARLAKIQADKEKEDTIKQAKENAKLAKEKADQDKADAIEAEKQRAEEEKQELIEEQEKKEKERLADIEREKQVKADAEAKLKYDQEELEKEKKYQKFLTDNEYTEENSDDFYISTNQSDKIITLYKKVATYKF